MAHIHTVKSGKRVTKEGVCEMRMRDLLFREPNIAVSFFTCGGGPCHLNRPLSSVVHIHYPSKVFNDVANIINIITLVRVMRNFEMNSRSVLL